MTAYVNACRSCGEPIRWEQTATSRPSPVSIRTGESHFIDCPQRREWRKQRSKQTALTPADQQRPLFGGDEEAECAPLA